MEYLRSGSTAAPSHLRNGRSRQAPAACSDLCGSSRSGTQGYISPILPLPDRAAFVLELTADAIGDVLDLLLAHVVASDEHALVRRQDALRWLCGDSGRLWEIASGYADHLRCCPATAAKQCIAGQGHSCSENQSRCYLSCVHLTRDYGVDRL
jgi:hypothetical protein